MSSTGLPASIFLLYWEDPVVEAFIVGCESDSFFSNRFDVVCALVPVLNTFDVGEKCGEGVCEM